MIVIEGNALTYLLDALKRSEEMGREVYKVSLDIRADGIAIKTNESVWTPTLSTN